MPISIIQHCFNCCDLGVMSYVFMYVLFVNGVCSMFILMDLASNFELACIF